MSKFGYIINFEEEYYKIKVLNFPNNRLNIWKVYVNY